MAFNECTYVGTFTNSFDCTRHFTVLIFCKIHLFYFVTNYNTDWLMLVCTICSRVDSVCILNQPLIHVKREFWKIFRDLTKLELKHTCYSCYKLKVLTATASVLNSSEAFGLVRSKITGQTWSCTALWDTSSCSSKTRRAACEVFRTYEEKNISQKLLKNFQVLITIVNKLV